MGQGWEIKVTSENDLFAYQGILGLSYYFKQNMIISLDYRYLATNEVKMKYKINSVNAGSVNERYENNLINLGFTYYFA